MAFMPKCHFVALLPNASLSRVSVLVLVELGAAIKCGIDRSACLEQQALAAKALLTGGQKSASASLCFSSR